MRTVGTGFQFRMGLCCDEPGMFRNLYHLYDPSVRGEAGELHAMTGEILPVVVVDFVAVPVPLFYFFTLIKSVCLGSFIQDTGICAEAESSSNIFHTYLVRHDMDDRMGGIGIQFSTVGIVETDNIPRKFNDSKLHAKAETKERNLMGSCIADGGNLPVDPAAAKSSPNSSSALSSVTVSESIHLMLTVARAKMPPCLKASTTLMYASWSWIYLPTRATVTSVLGLFR